MSIVQRRRCGAAPASWHGGLQPPYRAWAPRVAHAAAGTPRFSPQTHPRCAQSHQLVQSITPLFLAVYGAESALVPRLSASLYREVCPPHQNLPERWTTRLVRETDEYGKRRMSTAKANLTKLASSHVMAVYGDQMPHAVSNTPVGFTRQGREPRASAGLPACR
jgi:hypothetical protein